MDVQMASTRSRAGRRNWCQRAPPTSVPGAAALPPRPRVLARRGPPRCCRPPRGRKPRSWALAAARRDPARAQGRAGLPPQERPESGPASGPAPRGRGDIVLRRAADGAARVEGLAVRAALHSPDGLEFGYGGSGPADTALSILLSATGDLDWSLAHHQAFRWAAVAPLPREGGALHGTCIRRWVAARGGPPPGRAGHRGRPAHRGTRQAQTLARKGGTNAMNEVFLNDDDTSILMSNTAFEALHSKWEKEGRSVQVYAHEDTPIGFSMGPLRWRVIVSPEPRRPLKLNEPKEEPPRPSRTVYSSQQIRGLDHGFRETL